jgi:hypothetical protein
MDGKRIFGFQPSQGVYSVGIFLRDERRIEVIQAPQRLTLKTPKKTKNQGNAGFELFSVCTSMKL